MKKCTFALAIISLLLLAGCGQNNVKTQEKLMEKYARQYYEDNMKNIIGQDTNEVSIKALKAFNDMYSNTYDLSSLKNCEDASYTSVIVHHKTREIKSFEHHLKCK